MADLMDKVGAFSTADKNRDAIMIGALLTDSHPVIIFPEGQMIKDKKIIEKGKYMVYNTGIRGPPTPARPASPSSPSSYARKSVRFHEKGTPKKSPRYAARVRLRTWPTSVRSSDKTPASCR